MSLSHEVNIKTGYELLDHNKNIITKGSFSQISQMENYITLELIGKSGDIKFVKVVPFRSFTNSFLKALDGALSGTAGQLGVETTDTSGSDTTFKQLCYTNALSGDDTFGIVIGTGNTAFQNSDYALVAKILHSGSPASGKMAYQATTYMIGSSGVWNTGHSTFYINREFQNNSGSAITVKEVGLIAKAQDDTNNDIYYMVARDVSDITPSTINQLVDAGETLRVKYGFAINSPYLRNFGKLLYLANTGLTSSSSTQQVTAVSGSAYSLTPYAINSATGTNMLSLLAGSNVDTYGIVLGNGTAGSFSVTDYKLKNKIYNSSVGLTYGAMSTAAPQYGATDSTIEFSRLFTNNSGTTISLTEAALYCIGGGGSDAVAITLNDISALSISIDAGNSLRFYYTFAITIP